MEERGRCVKIQLRGRYRITRYDGSDGGDLGQMCLFRCPLKRAMQLIVSTDPKRAKGRAEYNEMFEETIVEDTDDDDDKR